MTHPAAAAIIAHHGARFVAIPSDGNRDHAVELARHTVTQRRHWRFGPMETYEAVVFPCAMTFTQVVVLAEGEDFGFAGDSVTLDWARPQYVMALDHIKMADLVAYAGGQP